jgi:hypothetical protein
MTINPRECAKACINPQEVQKIAKRIEKVCRDADLLGLTLFCGTSDSLRFTDQPGCRPLILASLYLPNTDGGDGSALVDSDGYERGE